MEPYEKKRAFLRVQITLEVRVAGPKGVSYGKLRDISKGNASFFLEEPVGGVGDTLDVFIPFSDKDEVAIMGELVRSEPTDRGALHAVRFSLVEPSMRKTLDRFLEHALAMRGSETRQHPRIAVQLPLLVRDPAEHRVTLETIALGGLSFTTATSIALKTDIQVEIPGPDLHLQGEVVSLFPAIEKGKRQYKIGAKFKNVTPEKRAALDLFIRSVLGVG